MYKPTVAIIIPTYQNDEALMQCVNSLLDIWQPDWQLIIIDQNEMEDYSEEKRMFYATAASPHHSTEDRHIIVLASYHHTDGFESLELGIAEAKKEGVPYTLMAIDTVIFPKQIRDIKNLSIFLDRYDVITMGEDPEIEKCDPQHETLGEEVDPINPTFSQTFSVCKLWYGDLVKGLMFLKVSTWNKLQGTDHVKLGFTNPLSWRWSEDDDG